jgi:hypothetical protein
MFEIEYLPNIGFAIDRVPQEIFEELKGEISRIESGITGEKSNDTLVGHIKKEFKIEETRNALEPYIMALAFQYLSEFDLLSRSQNNKPCPMSLGKVWVNFQSKGEFNPVHKHSGILSFVIWVKIPYDLAEEEKVFPEVKNPRTSKFEFQFTNILGNIVTQSVDVDKNTEGTICMFPAELNHCVYPFYTSDEYRISISGNVVMKID